MGVMGMILFLVEVVVALVDQDKPTSNSFVSYLFCHRFEFRFRFSTLLRGQ
jgi:hypothetical protein